MSPLPSVPRGSARSMPSHHSTMRDGSYSSFQTSSTGAVVVVLSSKAGMRAPSGREGFEVLQLALHARQLLCRVDRPCGGAAEVDEVAEVLVGVERRADALPC